MEKTVNAPRQINFPLPTPGIRSAGEGVLFSLSFHMHFQRGRVWKEDEKKHLTAALGQELEEGNECFLGSLSAFS